MRKRYYLLPLGCPKNNVDAEGMRALLQEAGWRQTQRPERADALIVNTCGFIDAAREESLAALRDLARSKQVGQVLLAAGCLSQRQGEALKKSVRGVDGILGTREWADVVIRLEQLLGLESAASVRPVGEPSVVTSVPRLSQGASAYVKIADGCSAPCAFCAIPLIKGPQCSKPHAAVMTEVQQLLTQGVREIILIAQDTTAYGRDLGQGDALPDLIDGILEVEPRPAWLRVMYTYPQHLTPRLIHSMACHPQVCHYLDLPLQHAHPATLRRMRRSPNMKGVCKLVADLRLAMPDIALRTAFIVGYPGETEEEFAALLGFMAEMAFDKVGVFIYSQEEGTPAAHLPDQVPRALAEERYARAMELQRDISLGRNRAQVGRALDVLIEGSAKGVSVGRSYRDAPEIDGYVFVEGAWEAGQIIPTSIERALDYDLQGRVASGATR